MSGRLRLGFLNRLYSPSFSPRVYEDALQLFAVAEELGFDTGWVAQHHFGCETGRLPSPLPLLAAAAQRTQRFGQDIAQRHSAYDARITQLTELLTGKELNANGQSLAPNANDLLQRTWEATSRVEQVAQRGNGLIVAPNLNLPPSAGLKLIERYRNAWFNSQRPARIALVRAVFPGSDANAPGSSLHQDIRRYIQGKQEIGLYDGDSPQGFSAELRRLGVLHGDPAAIAQQLAEDTALGANDQLVVQVQTSSTTLDEAIRHLQRVAEEIAPALGWHPASAPATPSETAL